MKLLGFTNDFKILDNEEEILTEYFTLNKKTKNNFSGFMTVIKFLVVLKDNEYYVIFFDVSKNEDYIAKQLCEKRFNFVGSGIIVKNIDEVNFRATFCSLFCKNIFGYDAPSDENLRKIFLNDIKNLSNRFFS